MPPLRRIDAYQSKGSRSNVPWRVSSLTLTCGILQTTCAKVSDGARVEASPVTVVDAASGLAASIPLHEPSFYERDLDEIHAALTEIRNREPVLWHEPGGFWVVTKHADIRHMGSNPQTFSSRFGFQIADTFPLEEVLPQLPPWAQEQLRSGTLTRAEQRGLIAR